MRQKSVLFLLLLGGLFIFAGVNMLLTPQPVLASSARIHPILDHPPLTTCKAGSTELQCGSQASSCKNCHEVQAEMPVNNDGTGWHESHAFGDFCIFCHAGNDQATEALAAHTAMVSPLSDVKAACQQCHSADLTERAQVYATILNVSLDNEAKTPIPDVVTNVPELNIQVATQQPPAAQPTSQPIVSVPVVNEIVIDDPNIVDYVQRYNEIVLGERPVNWGNVVLVALIGLIVVGGGGFVILNEARQHTSTMETKRIEGEYPVDVVDMLPAIAKLKVQTRQALKKILSNPRKTEKVLNVIDTLVSDEESEENTP